LFNGSDLVFVTACNLSFLVYTECMVRSLLLRGQVAGDEITVMVLGPKPERDFMRARLQRLANQIRTIEVDPFDSQFKFIAEIVEAGHWTVFADYLRAWVGQIIPRCVWMDSDILVNGDLSRLRALLGQSETIQMARCHPIKSRQPPDRFAKLRNVSADMYRVQFGEPLPDSGGDGRFDCNWNSGVMILDRSYDALWRQIFCQLGPYWRTTFRQTIFTPVPYGQAIWNLIFWRMPGCELDPMFNCVDPLTKPGLINHYCMSKSAKLAMLSDAVRLNLV
jgi:hypothetical protein